MPDPTDGPQRNGIPACDKALYAILAVACFFLFMQSDVIRTGSDSFKYLNGHIRDFYEVGGDYGPSEYLPSNFIVFAVWNLPLKLLGYDCQSLLSVRWAAFWFKLASVLGILLSAAMLYRVSKRIGLAKPDAQMAVVLWLSMPLMLFGSLILGQYDSFYLFLTLWALDLFLEGKLFRFSLLMGIAITFKYFPIFLYFPLLFLREKRIGAIFKHAALFAVPFAAEVFFYRSSPGFRAHVLELGLNTRAFAAAFVLADYHEGIAVAIFPMLWFLLCGFAYFRDSTEDRLGYDAVYLCLAGMSVFLSMVFWHPHWFVLLTPFLVLTTLLHKRSARFLLVDAALMLLVVAFAVHCWPGNVDFTTFKWGLLKVTDVLPRLNPLYWSSDLNLKMGDIYRVGNLTQYQTAIAACLLLNVLLKFPDNSGACCPAGAAARIRANWGLVRFRYYSGIALFLIPASVCLLWAPGEMIYRIRQENKAPLAFVKDVGGQNRVEVVFKANCKHLQALSIMLLPDNSHPGQYEVRLSDMAGHELLKKSLPRLMRNENYSVLLGGLAVNPGEFYKFEIARAGVGQHRPISVMYPKDWSDPNLYTLVNGVKQPFSICFALSGKK